MEAISKDSAMADIVDWLAGVEERASALYAKAALAFAADKAFAAFLGLLAEEEAEHLELLSGTAAPIARQAMGEACFSLDESIRRNVEAPLERAHDLLKKGGLTKAAMLGIIAEVEFSEWNEIFLYVVDTLKGHGRELQKAVAEIDHHRHDIENYIASFAWGDRILQKIGSLRPVWKRRILVVEDDVAIANLIASLIRAEAEVVLAEDGAEGLARIRESHFDVVVSDVEMPNLNGIELYQRALAVDPCLGKRFVFFTGTGNPEYRGFIESTECVLLSKPAPLTLLRKVINEVAAS
ncbi:MAG: response regulator [Syntrophotaleaceae bacterium]